MVSGDTQRETCDDCRHTWTAREELEVRDLVEGISVVSLHWMLHHGGGIKQL